MAVTGWFSDGFDYYATAQLLQRWTGQTSSSPTINIISSGGRRNSGYVSLYASGVIVGFINKAIPNTQDCIVNAAVKFTQTPATTTPIITLGDGATTQVDIRFDTSNHIVLTRNGTVLATSTAAIVDMSAFHYVELAAHIADAPNGWAIVRVDGIEWLNVTGVDTQANTNAYTNLVTFSGGRIGVMTATYYDDVLIRWGSGLSSADLLGDLGITGIFPTADSIGANWAYGGAGIASHWDAVNDATPDGDTSYDESSTVGAEQRFVFGDIPAGVTVPGVEVIAYARKTDAGVRNLKFYVVTNGSTRYSDPIPLTDSYLYCSWFWILNPVTGAAWTAAEVNAAEFGYRLDA